MLKWFLDYDCLSAKHPSYPDEYERFHYEIFEENYEWLVYFEGTKLFSSQDLRECIDFCEQDVKMEKSNA